uniref:J domain-containing protein n=1 Tax=Acrobeloides nanus TaxID=290746 RepID=A0A914BYH6_9BILA
MRFVSYRPKKKTYYEVLGIESNASYEEVKEAFVALAKLLHPDGQSTSTSEASTAEINQTEKFMLVREAYEVLRNPEKRRAYDQGSKISQQKSNKSMEVIMKSDLSSSPAREDQVIDVQRLKTERYGLGNGKFYDIDLEDQKEDEMKKLWRRVITIFLLSMIGNYLFVEYSTRKPIKKELDQE